MGPPESSRPLLAVDVDGVVSIFGFDALPESASARFEMIDGLVRCIPSDVAERLLRLADRFELVWASGWEEGVNRLAERLGLPRFPYLTFGGKARFGTADWKLGPLESYAAGRALAWIDDSFDERCYAWAASREEPTLLVATEPHRGLGQSHEDALTDWASGLAREGRATEA